MPAGSGRGASGRMAGVDLPLTPMQHHYLITEDLPELVAQEE